jgi:hypothetical protein
MSASAGDRKLLINSAAKNAFAVDAETGALCWKVSQEDPKNSVCTIPVLARDELVLTNASRGRERRQGAPRYLQRQTLSALQRNAFLLRHPLLNSESQPSTLCSDSPATQSVRSPSISRGFLYD